VENAPYVELRNRREVVIGGVVRGRSEWDEIGDCAAFLSRPNATARRRFNRSRIVRFFMGGRVKYLLPF
jgi:hypothetical protein